MENLFVGLEKYLAAGSFLAYLVVFAGGILASFTPCVYPLVPITIGYIGARTSGSKLRGFFLSLFYVVGVAFTYAILGAIAALTGKLFGRVQTSPVSYFIVANVCIFLGLSMLELYNLPIPNFLSGVNPKNKIGGFLGSFLVGAASGLVMGPCTAPAVGALLVYVATRRNLVYGFSLLFTFALGMGILLLIAGTFSGIISSLPKGGPWMVRIKKLFGWLLLGAGEFFLIAMGRTLV